MTLICYDVVFLLHYRLLRVCVFVLGGRSFERKGAELLRCEMSAHDHELVLFPSFLWRTTQQGITISSLLTGNRYLFYFLTRDPKMPSCFQSFEWVQVRGERARMPPCFPSFRVNLMLHSRQLGSGIFRSTNAEVTSWFSQIESI